MNQDYQYSNGLDLLKAIPALVGRLKWTSDAGTEGSKSGRYFDDNSFHSLVTEKALKDLQPDAAISNENFTLLKSKFEKAAIAKALTAVFSKPSLIETTLLHEILPENRPSQLPVHEFVGFKVVVAESNDIMQQVDNVVLHFDTDTPVILYLFKEGEAEHIWTETVEAKGGKYTVAPLKNCILSFAQHKAKTYYIGYKPSELTGTAKPYSDSIRYEHPSYTFGTYIVAAPSIPIYEQGLSNSSHSNGLNLEITALYDNTTQVVRSPNLFDELVGLINAAMIIELGLFTNRSNATERKATDNIDKLAAQLDLMGAIPVTDGPTTIGLRSKIKSEVLKVQASFTKKRTGVISLC